MATKRVNVSFSNDLLTKIDDYAKKMGVSRSAFIAYVCAEKVSLQDDLMQSIKNTFEEVIKENSNV